MESIKSLCSGCGKLRELNEKRFCKECMRLRGISQIIKTKQMKRTEDLEKEKKECK